MNRPPIEEIRERADAYSSYWAKEDVPALLDYIAFLEKGLEELAGLLVLDADGEFAFADGFEAYIGTEEEPNLHAAVSQAKERITK